MLNWTTEKRLEIFNRIPSIAAEFEHETNVIKHMVMEHPYLAEMYLSRLKDISTELEVLLKIQVTLAYKLSE